MGRLARLSMILFLAGHAASVEGQAAPDWPRFRGPNGSGQGLGAFPTTFGADKIRWKTPLPAGQSSPVVFLDRVIVTGSEGKTLSTICLNKDTGAVVWRCDVERTRDTKVDSRNSSASPTAAVSGDTVVVFFPDLGLLAMDAAGKETWRLLLGPFRNVYGMGASPIIHRGKVFLVCDQNKGSYVLAVDKATGKTLWKTDRPYARSGHCTPIVHEPKEGSAEVLLPGSFYLDAYDVDTGARRWWVSGLSFEMKSTPVMHEGVLYINGFGSPLNQPGRQLTLPTFDEVVSKNDDDGDGRISEKEMPASPAKSWFSAVDLDENGFLEREDWDYLRDALKSQNGLLAIRVGGVGDVTESAVLWSARRWVPQLPSPLVFGGALCMLDDQGGRMTFLDLKSGEVLKRGRVEGASDNYYASPVAAGERMLLVGESGLVSVLDTSRSLKPLAVTDLDEKCHATPAIAGGRVYLRTEKTLYCFEDK